MFRQAIAVKGLSLFVFLCTLSAAGAWAEPPAPVPKTGQTTCYDSSGTVIGCAGTGQDGDYQKGVAWPDPRFSDNANGTVTDNLTGLIWLKNANCFGARTWTEALEDANGLASGSCGLTDGSIAGDWRLPNIREVHSLIDYGHGGRSLPRPHPFSNVLDFYWSSTARAYGTDDAWLQVMSSGRVDVNPKSNSNYVWPMRDAYQKVPPNCGDSIIQWKQGETCDPPSSICGSRGNPNWVCSDTCQCEFIRGN